MFPSGRIGQSTVVCVYLLLILLCAGASQAQDSSRFQIGSSNTVTADAPVPRPHHKPCVVQLFSNFQFVNFDVHNYQFSPDPCPGPWEKVVFTADFNVTAGRQFDRTAVVNMGFVNLYFGTTPEPRSTLSPSWHVERDVTDYGALFTSAQTGHVILGNIVNSTYTGVISGSAALEFYPKHGNSERGNDPEDDRAHPADAVYPLKQVNSNGSISEPAFLHTPTDQLATTFTLPRNIEQVYLDVIAQSQINDEQWFACFPDDLNNINAFYGCGHTAFRETEVTIDGTPAGVAPVSPWIYTGFLPDQWAPIPGVQTLNFVPYRVNLTPFAALLNDGQPHTLALKVFNDDDYFAVTASLLLYLDPESTRISGGILQNTLTDPPPQVTEDLQGTSVVTGTIGVSSKRQYTIAGYIETSRGRITTSISQRQDFSATQAIDFDTVNFTVLNQNTSLETKLSSATTVSSRKGTNVTYEDFSFPLKVDVTFPVPSARFGFTVATTQNYGTSKLVLDNGTVRDFQSVSNSAKASDVSPNSSSQHYTLFDKHGQTYDCAIASQNNVLTSVSEGCSDNPQQ